MADLIDRQQAIDGMRKLQRWNVVRGYNKNEGFLYDDVMYLLEKLPSAQPTQTNADSTQSNTLDCVSRQAVAKWLERWDGYVDKDIIERMKLRVIDIPSAQPEQKKGKWERVYLDHVASGERPSIFYCSSCNQCVPFPTNFCPACGSDNR